MIDFDILTFNTVVKCRQNISTSYGRRAHAALQARLKGKGTAIHATWHTWQAVPQLGFTASDFTEFIPLLRTGCDWFGNFIINELVLIGN